MEENQIYNEQNPPNFLGFFSPVIDGALVSLMNASTPGNPEYEVYAKGTDRFMTLHLLESEMIDSDNNEVAAIITKLAADNKPFGLYLRNFALGARTRPAVHEQYGVPQMATMMSPDDIDMQSLLKNEFPEIPFVAISNPAYHTKTIPQLILSNDRWMQAADNLIKHAGFIVMFFLTATPGVNDEINMLRSAGAQKRTIIVIAPEDPRNNSLGKSMLAIYGELPETGTDTTARDMDALHSLLPDFPYIINLEKNGKQKTFIAAMHEIISAAAPIVNKEIFSIPPRPKPAAQLLQLAHNGALNEFTNGQRFYEAGDGKAAEDAFIRSIVFNYWAWDRLGRAVAFLNLGHTERYLLKYPNEAVDCYFKSLNLMVSILDVSPTARESYKVLALGLSEYLRDLGDAARAQSVVDKYLKAFLWRPAEPA